MVIINLFKENNFSVQERYKLEGSETEILSFPFQSFYFKPNPKESHFDANTFQPAVSLNCFSKL